MSIMIGRPPKPTEAHIAAGNPGGRHLPEVAVGLGKVVVMERPNNLHGNEIEVWDRVVPEVLELGWIDQIDKEMLTLYVRTLALAERAAIDLAKDDLTVYTSKGMPSANPLTRVQLQATQTAKTLAEQYGFTPSARARLGMTSVKGMTLAADLEKRLALDDIPETIVVEAIDQSDMSQ